MDKLTPVVFRARLAMLEAERRKFNALINSQITELTKQCPHEWRETYCINPEFMDTDVRDHFGVLLTWWRCGLCNSITDKEPS